MANIHPGLFVAIGMMLIGVMRIPALKDMPPTLHRIVLLLALASILLGYFQFLRSPAMQDSKLREWKLWLLSKIRL